MEIGVWLFFWGEWRVRPQSFAKDDAVCMAIRVELRVSELFTGRGVRVRLGQLLVGNDF